MERDLAGRLQRPPMAARLWHQASCGLPWGQPVHGLGVCSLSPAFAASWPHHWQVPSWQPLPPACQPGIGRALTRGDLALWSQGCSPRPVP